MTAATPASAPGRSWLEILSRDADTFRRAFSALPTLEASVLRDRLVGVEALQGFFQATRSMYDTLVFTGEATCGLHVLLEWEGLFEDRTVAGVTVLVHDAGGAITQVQMHHRPHDQVIAFSAALAGKL